MVHSKPAQLAPVIVIDLQTGMFDGIAESPLHEAELLEARVRKVIDWGKARRPWSGLHSP